MALKSPRQLVIYLVGNLQSVLTFAFVALQSRPVFFLGGLSAVSYGLYLNFSLGTALIFAGAVFMAVGYLMEGRK